MNKLFQTITRAPSVIGGASETSDTTPEKTALIVRDLEVSMSIGVHAHEHSIKQRVLVNIEVSVDRCPTWTRDNINDVMSYEDIVEGVSAIAARGHINLVERYAEEIALLVLSNPKARQAKIRVEKTDIYPNAAAVGVEIIRQRR